MNSRTRNSLALAAVLSISGVAYAQERAIAVNTEGMAPFLAAKVQAKITHGENTEAAFAGEIAEFDSLLAKHQGEKTEDVAQILVMKALLYIQVLKNAGEAPATDAAATQAALERSDEGGV